MALERPIPPAEWVFLFFGHTEARGASSTQERREAKIQIELAHEAEEAQFEPGSNERKIA